MNAISSPARLFRSLRCAGAGLGILFATTVLAQSADYRVERRPVAIGFPAEAVVEAVNASTVATQLSGRILDVKAEAGQAVRRGQLLMRIDAREAAGGDAAAQANLAQARSAYERTRHLHQQKFVSQAALDQAESAWKAAQGAAGATGATASHAEVTAPISGLVAQRHADVGDMATPGAPLFTLFDPAGLRVVATIPQHRLAEVRKAGKARVEFPELKLSVDAARVEILPAVDARSHTATARLYLPAGLAGVVPGMAARAQFATGETPLLTVPSAAILRRGEVTAVYVVADGKAPRLRQVRLGETVATGDVTVLAGLAEGERISLDPVQAGIRAVQAAQSPAQPPAK